MMVEARIRTEDVSRAQRGQAAKIRFTAVKYRTTQLVVVSVTQVLRRAGRER